MRRKVVACTRATHLPKLPLASQQPVQLAPLAKSSQPRHSWAKEVTPGTEIPQATQASQPTFCHFLTKRGEMFLLETKSRLGQQGDPPSRVTSFWLQGHPPPPQRVKLSFLHINTLAHPARSTRPSLQSSKLVEVRIRSIRGHLTRANTSPFFSYKRSLKLTRLGG